MYPTWPQIFWFYSQYFFSIFPFFLSKCQAKQVVEVVVYAEVQEGNFKIIRRSNIFLFFLLFVFWDKISVCSETHFVKQAGFKVTDIFLPLPFDSRDYRRVPLLCDEVIFFTAQVIYCCFTLFSELADQRSSTRQEAQWIKQSIINKTGIMPVNTFQYVLSYLRSRLHIGSGGQTWLGVLYRWESILKKGKSFPSVTYCQNQVNIWGIHMNF